MLRFRDIDVENEEQVSAMVRWANDPEIRHLFLRFEGPQQYDRPLSFELAQTRLRSSLDQGRVLHLLEWKGQIVGEVSLDMDSKALLAPEPGTAWFGLVIGEKEARGKGLGRRAIEHMEEIARSRGATRAEIGVFEFNERAQRLYRSLGYQELATIPNFTWWKGKLWTDIRMGKCL